MSDTKTTEYLIRRNIEMSAEFSRYIFEHPELEDSIPAGAELVLLPDGDPQLNEFNLKLGKEMQQAGDNVIFVSIGKLRPQQFSRIEKAEFYVNV